MTDNVLVVFSSRLLLSLFLRFLGGGGGGGRRQQGMNNKTRQNPIHLLCERSSIDPLKDTPPKKKKHTHTSTTFTSTFTPTIPPIPRQEITKRATFLSFEIGVAVCVCVFIQLCGANQKVCPVKLHFEIGWHNRTFSLKVNCSFYLAHLVPCISQKRVSLTLLQSSSI